jgi:hypothetical protein
MIVLDGTVGAGYGHVSIVDQVSAPQVTSVEQIEIRLWSLASLGGFGGVAPYQFVMRLRATSGNQAFPARPSAFAAARRSATAEPEYDFSGRTERTRLRPMHP